MSKSKYMTTLSFIKWTLRNNVLGMIIYSAIMFVVMFYNHSGYSSVYEMLSILISCGYILVVSSKMSGYLHNKRKSDVYNALPLSNLNLYFNNYISGLITLLIPITITLVGLALVNYELNFARYLLFYYLSITLLYTFSMTIGVLCYKKRDMITTIITFAVAIPLVIIFYNDMLVNIIPGYIGNEFSFSESTIYYVLYFISPAIAVIFSSDKLYYDNDYELSFGTDMQLMLLATVVLFVIGILVARKRKAELVENTYSINVIPIISTALIAGVGCNILYMFVANATHLYDRTVDGNIDPMLVFILTLVFLAIFAIITYFVSMKLLFKCSMSKTKNILACLIVATITGSMFTIMATGAFGTDTYTPNTEDVKKAHIQLSTTYYEDSLLEISGISNYDRFPTYTDKEDIQQIIDTNNLITDFIKKYSIYPYIMKTPQPYYDMDYVIKYSDYEKIDKDIRVLNIRYDMETGGDVVRKYELSDIVNSTAPDSEKEKVMNAIQGLANTTEFKEAYTDNLLTDTSEFTWKRLVEREYLDNGNGKNTYYDADSSKSDLMYEFNEALKKDILADDEFCFNMYDERNDKIKYFVELESFNYIYVPKSYTNTLEVWDELRSELKTNTQEEEVYYESDYYNKDFNYAQYDEEGLPIKSYVYEG